MGNAGAAACAGKREAQSGRGGKGPGDMSDQRVRWPAPRAGLAAEAALPFGQRAGATGESHRAPGMGDEAEQRGH